MRSYILWTLGGILLLCRAAMGMDLTPEAVGARTSFPGNTHAEHFFEAEICADWDLPWRWNLGSDWNLLTRLDTSAGWLQNRNVYSFLWTLGPGLALGRERWPVRLVGGGSPTLLSRYEFPDHDLGIPLQFTSYGGLEWDITSRFRLDYRYKHMSNGGLDGHNPGLNFHSVGLSYVF
ncbi:MAG: hypothetical protein C5B50_06450 [Verrucomicrobia bacterium]|nr:MAG: hypothetical protein C5B50_06450 [Verrucomicrobiota bacterium]